MMAIICLGIIFSVFTGDLLIKNQAEKRLKENEIKEVLGGRILLRKHHNAGAAFNLGEKYRTVVAAVSVALTLLVFVIFVLSLGQRGNGMLRAGLSLLLGGSFSNNYDRLKRKYVVDYLSFGVKWKPLRNIIFNLSDFCIMAGALLTALAW